MQGYTTRDAAELLGISEAQVRSLARAGFLNPRRGPRGTYRFSFQDIVLLRAASERVRSRVPARRVRRARRKLLEQLPSGRPLSSVRVTAAGDQVVVREAGVAWQPDSGQTVLDFEVSEIAARLEAATDRRVVEAADDEGMDSEDWYLLGVDLDAAAPERARGAYERAIALDSTNADAQVNLGRLLHESGEIDEADRHYRAALAADPSHAVAAFNLGTALEDRARRDEAVAAYRLAIEIDPAFTDAHFNLARLYEAAGMRVEALRHLRSYRALTV
jgi:tetratricopeptide (TPR) repeat protein